jgi:hypothetical protein
LLIAAPDAIADQIKYLLNQMGAALLKRWYPKQKKFRKCLSNQGIEQITQSKDKQHKEPELEDRQGVCKHLPEMKTYVS